MMLHNFICLWLSFSMQHNFTSGDQVPFYINGGYETEAIEENKSDLVFMLSFDKIESGLDSVKVIL